MAKIEMRNRLMNENRNVAHVSPVAVTQTANVMMNDVNVNCWNLTLSMDDNVMIFDGD
jgi:hypothetical protein